MRHNAEIRALRKQLASAIANSGNSFVDKENAKPTTDKTNKDKNCNAKPTGLAKKRRGVLDSLNVNQQDSSNPRSGKRVRQCKIETMWKMSRMS